MYHPRYDDVYSAGTSGVCCLGSRAVMQELNGKMVQDDDEYSACQVATLA